MSEAGELLKGIDIFSELSEAELSDLYALMNRRNLKEDEVLFREGDDGDEMFVVVDGSIEIDVALNDGKKVVIAVISAGDFLGEMSIVEQLPRSATCTAKRDSTLLSLSAKELLKMMDKKSSMAVKVLHRMAVIAAQRLQKTGQFVSEMVQWGENARKRAITDEATGLFNRRYLDDTLESLFRRAKMENRMLSYAMFDLDRFGSLNNTYGLAFGDHVIVEMSKKFSEVFITSDILVRYGGDEFTFIFPDSPPDEVLLRCDRLCEKLRQMNFEEHEELQISCSIGVASYPAHAQNLDDLKEAADKALYQAKEDGRDRTILYSG